ncbi:MAG TPA: hypothetical protein VFZ76_10880 [Anaerolineales bacterium]
MNQIPLPSPPHRRLRGYAFDPSLSTQLETIPINEVVFKVPWEKMEQLEQGPVGEYLEVVDYDPASQCFYAPVDLDDPLVIAQDGLSPSEGNPQFHQQMVYAVAMTAIKNFERALGRRAHWAPRADSKLRDPSNAEETFVKCLRIYPHALREANAYYSPNKKALLFGYFPATTEHPGIQFPGGTVFTCLSHDIVAHETTHALLDGMHSGFLEPTHPDVFAFHEAFADIVALFQHFSFPEVLHHQIANTRGDLAGQSLLGQLAQQFGRAIGHYGALRNAIGQTNPETGQWEPLQPDPQEYQNVFEPHARGAILVAAVFDAFISIYKTRIADLFRIATSGTGILPEGAIHPDLVNRLSQEAAKSAQHVLSMCIRALDYCPPFDLTFGDYLRALITADSDLIPNDDRGYRVAFIEAFRRRGIYPQDVRTLSLESLRWPGAQMRGDWSGVDALAFAPLALSIRDFVEGTRLLKDRREIFTKTESIKSTLFKIINEGFRDLPWFEDQTGLVLGSDHKISGLETDQNGNPVFQVHAVRPAQRVGPNGNLLNQVIISLVQHRHVPLRESIPQGQKVLFRGGGTLILDLDEGSLRYRIVKPIDDEQRLNRQRTYLRDQSGRSLRATYFGSQITGEHLEPFAILHREF